MKYRIVKISRILYEEKEPKKEYWYVIQVKVVTCIALWIPMWFDMYFNNYANSAMTFDTHIDAGKYINKLIELEK